MTPDQLSKLGQMSGDGLPLVRFNSGQSLSELFLVSDRHVVNSQTTSSQVDVRQGTESLFIDLI